MATNQPPPPEAQSSSSYASAIHNLSLACLVVCPVLIALPPRKLDLYTATLGATTILSASRLHRETYGTSLLARFSPFSASTDHDGYPTQRAREVAAALKRQREEGFSDAQRDKAAREKADRDQGVLDKVWYGKEGADWKAKRDKEVKEKFDEGKGIGNVIIDQIWEVVTWGKSESKDEGGEKSGGREGSAG